eukprot:Phypoly_transcript_17116.p1 GENE.Phypoly_transcript_17116~~Phypoly_transcript_17116.p1  ORF type:complete len:138 (+),score=20.93 Phypoly_transcript_17116:297-710(+)
MKDFSGTRCGKVSKEDLLVGVEKHFIGKTPDTLPDWWKNNAKELLDGIDTNKRGELTFEETTTMLKRVTPATPDADIAEGFQWICNLSPSGKFDATTVSVLLFQWATSPHDSKQLRTIDWIHAQELVIDKDILVALI